ncbi:hypothetical protein ASG67_12315 [Sphingomonas sp. Leaf339]|nr:hypothetical protein ASG67_12315 [Sphingomonas sp. Leaf339]
MNANDRSWAPSCGFGFPAATGRFQYERSFTSRPRNVVGWSTPAESVLGRGDPRADIRGALTLAEQLHKHWDWRPALLDGAQLKSATRMRDGTHPMVYLFGAARAHHGRLIPVTGFARDLDYQAAVAAIVATDRRGLALRCALDDTLDADLDTRVAELLAPMGLAADGIDLLLDLGSPAFEPQDMLIDILVAALTASATVRAARSVTLIATSFPETLSTLDGPIHVVQRSEWLLYKGC